ncbi:hypothetical protein [Paraliomyxa miuraensis]|uniref:hypothetical protein n=1 Tax=Paraliomyxa miuraensis TaxID=376150 RepID=UPI00225059C1|nr:hypothetical protein [Paraliomyxa miuraensis]MCX4245650.1 hypothetical protein [Paraliomyxa miuraensis]
MRTLACTILSLSLTLAGGCGKGNTVDPATGSNLVGDYSNSDSLSEDDLGFDDEPSDLEDDGSEVEVAALPELPKPAKPVNKCTTRKEGTGKKKKTVKECGLVDPKPEISASHGARTLKGDYRWGMSTKDVFKLLSREIEKEYGEKQTAAADDAMAQDSAREWRAGALQDLKANHVRFKAASKHRWGVSLIQYEYEDDSEEEMLWVKANPTLRKFYFFKDGRLWKIFYAYSPETWPGMDYAKVVEDKFKKWFGVSPKEKVKQDPETAEPLVRYYEWQSSDGDTVRSFDMTAIHGVVGLAVIDAAAEKSIGERLPNVGKDDKFTNTVNDVLGGSDLCYNDSGEIIECKKDE